MTHQYDLMVDIDDVLFPWADGIHERAGAAGLHQGQPYTQWSMWEDYLCSKEDWMRVVGEAAEDGFYVDTPPMPGSIEALRRLHWAGDRIHLVTARGFPWPGAEHDHSEVIKEWTQEWVWEHAVPHATLTFAKDKVAAMHELGVFFDFAIDDGPHNFEALRAAGVKAYLLDRPHNRSFEVCDAPIGERVNSVDQWADIILEETA